MKRFFLSLVVASPLFALAQSPAVYTPYAVPAIVIDKVSKKTTGPLPFDKSFTLQYQLDTGESLFHVYMYKVRVVKGVRNILDANDKATQIALEGFDTVKSLLTIHVPALPPNTAVDIAIERQLNKAELDSLMIIDEDLYGFSVTHFATDLDITKTKYNKFIQNNLIQKSYQKEPGFLKYDFANYRNFFDTRLLSSFSAIKNHVYLTYNSSTPAIPVYTALGALKYVDVKTLDKRLLEKKIPDDDLLPLALLLNRGGVTALMDGTADMTSKDPVALLADDDDYETRIDNLTQAITYMGKLVALLERAQLAVVVPADLYKDALLYERGLKDNKALLVKNYNAIRGITKADPKLNANEWLLSQNQFNDLSLLSKNVVMPDIGLATLVFKGHDRYQAFPRPFIGMNIYFRPVDKTLSDNDFAKWNPARNLSLQVGLTYGKLSGKEFSALFNDFNLIIGPSYRLVRWFRFGLGTALAQQTDANPLIAQTHTKFGYYASLSFDLDILSNATQATARVLK